MACSDSRRWQCCWNWKEVNFEDHKRFILDIFTEIITQNDIFFQTLEDINIYWNDDFELVLKQQQ